MAISPAVNSTKCLRVSACYLYDSLLVAMMHLTSSCTYCMCRIIFFALAPGCATMGKGARSIRIRGQTPVIASNGDIWVLFTKFW